MIGLISNHQKPIPLKSIDVSVRICGTVAEVESNLCYYNEEEAPVEATYTFPVDDGSAVFKFEASVNGRKIVAEIQEKEQAKLTYEDSLEQGKVAALLKQDEKSADIFQCMLGNLPAKSEARLTLSYVIELPQELDGFLRFTLPTILNPRYSPDAGSTIAAEGATYVPPCMVPYQFTFTAKVKGYHKVESVTSDGCKLKVEMQEENHVAMVTLAEEFKFDHDLCLMVKYEECFTPQVVMEMGNSEAEGIFKEDLLMLSFRPDLKEVDFAKSGEYVFIIDCSGSMGSGDKMTNAKEALLLFLKSLPPDCYFNIVRFGGNYSVLFSSDSKKYTEETLSEAIKLQENMSSNMGGTEILKPLQHVYKQKAIKGHNRTLFLLTDGEVGNTNAVVGLVKKNAGSNRVFALGIGRGASTALVSGIARAGNGKAEFIADGSRIQPKVVSLLKCAMQPACTNVELKWDLPPDVAPISIPVEMPAMITAGERFTIFAIMQGVDSNTIYGPSSVTLKGQIEGQPVSYTLTFTLADDVQNASPTSPAHRLAAKTQIKVLEDEEASKTSAALDFDYYEPGDVDLTGLRNKAISLSRYANVISKWTAFVAVDLEGEKVQGTMLERPCPVPTITQEFYEAQTLRQDSFMFRSCGLADSAIGCSYAGGLQSATSYSSRARLQLFSSRKRSSPKKKKKGGVGMFNLLSCTGKRNKKKSQEDEEPYLITDRGMDLENEMKRDCSQPEEIMISDDLHEDDTLENCMAEPIQTNDIDIDTIDKEADSVADSVATDKANNSEQDDSPMDLSSKSKTDKRNSSEISPDDNMMLAVIRDQQIKGNWKLSDTLAKYLQLSVTQIKAAIPLKDDSVACTVVVLAWLEKYFMSRREEWHLIKTKALAWLETQPLESNSVLDLLEACKKTLWLVE